MDPPAGAAEPAEPAKPVFVSKAERERLELQRCQAAVAVQRRSTQPPPASGSNPLPRREHHDARDRGRKRGRESREGDQERELEQDKRVRNPPEKAAAAERQREKELDAIRQQYLGSRRPKMRVIRPWKKFRFTFDWENTDDTTSSRDGSESPGEEEATLAPLLFGRGFLAGIDRREQKKAAAAAHDREEATLLRRKAGAPEDKASGAGAARNNKAAAAADGDMGDDAANRHWKEKALDEMTERDWRIFREDMGISYKGRRAPPPMRRWGESGLAADLLRAVLDAGYRRPTPIQMAAIPLGLRRRDVIGVAGTGSGKTAAFVLPLLAHVARLPPLTASNKDDGPYAVVLAPTRELAQQIEQETARLAAHLAGGRGVKVVSVVGGRDVQAQRAEMDKGCEAVVATPGRLLDCLERRYVVLNQCTHVVLDKADRMVDLGFEPQVAAVLDAMPASTNLNAPQGGEYDDDGHPNEKRVYHRTTHMFSATMPPAVERLARKYLRDPVVVTVATPANNNNKTPTTALVAQNVVMVKESEKMPRLQRLLRDLGDTNQTAIVFCNTRKAAEARGRELDRAGFRAATIHGGRSQEQREASLDAFRGRRCNVLVATDVAARGIDVAGVAHVVNYDMPGSIEAYTHRIGRTGRAGRKGVATSFLTMEDAGIFFDLKQMLVQSNNPVPPELARHKASKFKPGSTR